MRINTKSVGKSIRTMIGLERRPAVLIGNDVDYVEVTRGVRALLIGVTSAIIVLVLLSLFVTVTEVARARGEFIPIRRIQVIQTPEGGAVQSVEARNDQYVHQGEIIATFRAEDLLRDLEQSQIRMAYLNVNIERLDAFASNRSPDFSAFEKKYPDIVREASSLNAEKNRERGRMIDQKDREIDEERSSLATAQQQLPSAKASRDAATNLAERLHTVAKDGFVPQTQVAQIEAQASSAERVYTELVAAPQEHEARIRRLQAEREAIQAKAAADARDERAKLIVQMNELKATQAAYMSRSEDIIVRAPVSGIVQKLSETLIGTVIPSGGTVCEIVPIEGGVLMRARVSPRDIGFVAIGQEVVVKSDAFDSSRFGVVPGKVVRVASTNTQDTPTQDPYILVEVELERFYVGNNREHILKPGMTGEATILTGKKTIFQYLLKPIYLTMDTAFRER